MSTGTAAPPDDIGPYRIVRAIGEGGMGVVYEAEQTEPIKRRVALKLVRPELSSPELAARFEAERQALAVMEHPGIATVLDAGTSPEGRPFLVMEYVEGLPIREFSDEHALPTEERLRLFIEVCHAVQHAHQKGVIHRDLKPSNVMVARQDGRASPRVIDFGVAKAIGSGLARETFATEFGRLLGTPAYMSPEQAEGVSLDVDTRADVYSLGVMLYELLVGRLPFDPEEKGLLPFLAMLMAGETTPVKPSVALTTLAGAGPETARRRGTDLVHLTRSMQGDLDWIVMKAIDHDRDRRYESAAALAADIRRYLDHEPVEARPPSTAYRMRKFARRHRAGVIGAAAAVLALIGGSVAASIGFVRATRAASLATSRELSATAITQLDSDGALSLLLAAEAAEASATFQAEDALEQALESRALLTLRHEGRVARSVFSPDGRVLATSVPFPSGTVHVWDARTGAEIRVFDAPPPAVLASSAAGLRVLGSNDEHVVEVRNVENENVVLTLIGHSDVLADAAFSLDGRRVATGSADGTVRIWDATTGEELGLVRPGKGSVPVVALSPEGRMLATVNEDRSAELWNVDTGDRIAELVHPEGFFTIAFSPDGNLVWVGSTDGTVRSYQADSGRECTLQTCGSWWTTPTGATGVYSVASSPDGRWLAAGHIDGSVMVYDRQAGRRLSLTGHTDVVASVAFDAESRRLTTASLGGRSAAAAGSARVWDLAAGAELLEVTPEYAYAVDVAPDGRRLATTRRSDAVVWDAESTSELLVLEGHRRALLSVEYSPDGQRLVTSSADSTARVWDAVSGAELLRLEHGGRVQFATFSPDGDRVATASSDGTAVLWDAATGDRLLVLQEHGAGVGRVVFDAEGQRLATAGADETVRVWDTTTGEELLRLQENARSIAFDPSGGRIATGGGNGVVTIWDSRTGLERTRLTGHTADVLAVAFSPDGTRLASGSEDATTRLWDAATGVEIVSYGGDALYLTERVQALAFGPDGRLLVVAGESGTRLYPVGIEALLERARGKLARPFTDEECRRYLHVPSC